MNEQTPIPPLSSVWQARDGRRMRVTKIVRSEWATGGWWAELDVLPPYAPRQRRRSQMEAKNFTDGFLKKEADFG